MAEGLNELKRNIGKPMPRSATRRLVASRGKYVDDFSLKGEMQAAFLRSPRPHAAFKIVDLTEASAADGVVAVLTAEDMDGLCKSWQADGAEVTTIDSGTPDRYVAGLQKSFFERAALQCGFCTPGMIMQAAELLRSNEAPTREQIREALSGNYCDCTGYQAIVDAVQAASSSLSMGDLGRP